MFKIYLGMIKLGIIFVLLAFLGYIGWLIAWDYNMSIGHTISTMILTSMVGTTLLLWVLNYIKGLIKDFTEAYNPFKSKKKIRKVDPTTDQITPIDNYY